MEMLLVLLIIAIVMAASAPMVNRKMLSSMAEKSPWVWTDTTGSIAYNLNGNDKQTTTIGAMALPNGSKNARLYISNGASETPQIAIGEGTAGTNKVAGDPMFYIHKYKTSLGISTKIIQKAPSSIEPPLNCIFIGNDAEATKSNGIAIGGGAFTQNLGGVVIGAKATTKLSDSVSGQGTAIGADTIASGDGSAALGRYAKATADGAVALGGWTKRTTHNVDSEDTAGAQASGPGSIAIGTGAQAAGSLLNNKIVGNTIAIGTEAVTMHRNSIAIGNEASDSDNNKGGASAIAIGNRAKASGDDSIAIGNDVTVNQDKVIRIGRTDQIVSIPNLVITKELFLVHHDGDGYSQIDTWFGNNTPVGNVIYNKNKKSWGTVLSDCGVTSDRRLKNVGEVFTSGLEQIKKLEVFNYTFKKDTEKTPRVGVMAQDLQKIFPNAVFKGEDGFLRIRMEDMFYALVNAVKELDAKVQMIVDKNIAGLKKQIADLEEENRVITEKNVALEKQIVSLYEQNAKLEERMNAIEKQLAIKKNK